jgi:hypothetical protein
MLGTAGSDNQEKGTGSWVGSDLGAIPLENRGGASALNHPGLSHGVTPGKREDWMVSPQRPLPTAVLSTPSPKDCELPANHVPHSWWDQLKKDHSPHFLEGG